jgi:hypothetical protein
MRTVRVEGPSIHVSDDPNRVISEFLAFALSLKNLSGRPPAEEFAERFSPQGDGLSLPDVLVAYRPETPEDIPSKYTEEELQELDLKEPWVLSVFRYGGPADSEILDGPELRYLLQEALALRNAQPTG